MVQMIKLLDKYILYAQARENIECIKNCIMENIKTTSRDKNHNF